jgi:hypothetical protein
VSSTGGVLEGVEQLVDDWLELSFNAETLPLYQHKTAALEVSKRKSIPSATGFLIAAERKMAANWEKKHRLPSQENWRFTQREYISEGNKSAEVGLERAIVQAADSNHWANQVPTSSGLIGPSVDKVRNVDLVYRDDQGNYSLIELKVASDNPLFAAIEILLYGVLLIWSRKNAAALGYTKEKQPVLFASSINLVVLAPHKYYLGDNRLDLTLLDKAINQGLTDLRDTLEIDCSFEFTKFNENFDPACSPKKPLKHAEQREAIWKAASN